MQQLQARISGLRQETEGVQVCSMVDSGAILRGTAGMLGNRSQGFSYIPSWTHKKRKGNHQSPETDEFKTKEANMLASLGLLWGT